MQKNNGKLPHLFIPSKTATLVPEFAVEDMHLVITAGLVSEFAVKYLPLGQNTVMMMMIPVQFVVNIIVIIYFNYYCLMPGF